MKRKPFRNGRVHIKASFCATCIFRPGSLIDLDPGRRDGMVALAIKRQSAITCHETLDGLQAVCRGFYEHHPTSPLQVASKLGYIEWQV